MADLTLETLMAELRKLERDDSPDGCATMYEIVEATGKGRDKISRMIRALCRSGAMECVSVRRPNVAGVVRHVPGYRLASKKEAANGKGKKSR